MNLFYQPLIPQQIHFLDAEESRHCVRVLRKTNGDHILITDGNGVFYNTIITNADPHRCEFEVLSEQKQQRNSYSIHIAISPTKNADRIEWFIEKAVEVGIDEITLLKCSHSERTLLKKDRLTKVAASAMKQSMKPFFPVINDMQEFQSFIKSRSETEKFIAYVDKTNPDHLKNLAPKASSYLVLIGPEGDFSADELILAQENGFKKISLGQNRLRTETAGLMACHTLNLINL